MALVEGAAISAVVVVLGQEAGAWPFVDEGSGVAQASAGADTRVLVRLGCLFPVLMRDVSLVDAGGVHAAALLDAQHLLELLCCI